MRIPDSLLGLLDHGVVEEVIRPLLSGKEAEVYLVISEGVQRVAKVYKEADQRNFKNRSTYTEGRRVRNSRDARAMQKRSRHGKAQDEAAWRSTEVDMIYRLSQAGVRVPIPYSFIDGILIMELVQGGDGQPAPRLGELTMSPERAVALFDHLLQEVVRMLCAGIVHGDLSGFNVLMGEDGPVLIDFPQAVEAAGNQNAQKLFLRDVQNLKDFVGRFAPKQRNLPFGEEIWQLYEAGTLRSTTRPTGAFIPPARSARPLDVVESIRDAHEDERRRLAKLTPQNPSRRRRRR
jgi:RIO kinase 1